MAENKTQMQQTDDSKHSGSLVDSGGANASKTNLQQSHAKPPENFVSDVAVFEEIEIYCGKPLPHYDVAGNKAFKASVIGRSGEPLFALVCESHILPRRGKAATIYSSIVNVSLANLVTYGNVYWPPAKQEYYVFIYNDNLGKPVMKKDAPLCMGWKQDQVMEIIVKPMVDILQDFHNKDFFHGAIRPSNMFDGGSGDSLKRIILGDCLSTPPSYCQPSLFETIERAMANPISRGTGRTTDDLYAFGVSLAVFMRTQDPLEGFSEEEVIEEKIKHGSYAAITGKDRFKGSILELLRGLLHDDPLQRWNIDEVMVWMDGRRLSPKQAIKRKKAARPFEFLGEKYVQAPVLAMALDKAPPETVKIVEDGSLEQWIERSLEDEHILERMQTAVMVSSNGGKGPGYEDRLVANLSGVLDPMGPFRFRGLKAMGDGLGPALYKAMVLRQDIKTFVDLFMQGLAMNWITACENPNLDIGGLVNKFDNCKNFLRQNKVGFGVERCLYTMAPEAACLSPKFEGYCVTSPEDMMFAFEDMCEKGEEPAFFLDRHSVAFLSVNDPKSVDGFLYDLNSPEEYKKVVGNLKALAMLQKRSKLPKLPHIGTAFLSMLPW